MTLPGSPIDHSACDFAWKQVRCDRCGREYQCTPLSDLYCTPEGDHSCESCLLGGRPVTTVVLVRENRERAA